MGPRKQIVMFILFLIFLLILSVPYRPEIEGFIEDTSKIANGNRVESWRGLWFFAIGMILIAGVIRMFIGCPVCAKRRKALEQQIEREAGELQRPPQVVEVNPMQGQRRS